MVEQLKTCPCCGGKAEVNRVFGNPRTFEDERVWVVCQRCGLSTRMCLSYKTAVNNWNRRTNVITTGYGENYEVQR